MKKDTIIAVIALLAIVAAIAYYYYAIMPKSRQLAAPQAKLTPEQQADKAANPFGVSVNPYDGYTNPFDK